MLKKLNIAARLALGGALAGSDRHAARARGMAGRDGSQRGPDTRGSAQHASDCSTPEFAYSGADFLRVRELIASYAGISLHERKHSMVYNRLVRRLRAIGLRSFREYL